jgi:hypothetical protein
VLAKRIVPSVVKAFYGGGLLVGSPCVVSPYLFYMWIDLSLLVWCLDGWMIVDRLAYLSLLLTVFFASFLGGVRVGWSLSVPLSCV